LTLEGFGCSLMFLLVLSAGSEGNRDKNPKTNSKPNKLLPFREKGDGVK